jgi:radical SAM protein with 4Fe4S-binding SPASM domain
VAGPTATTPALPDGAVERARAAVVPLHVLLELTYRCNVRCVHCYLAGREEEMSLAELTGLLDELAEEGCLVLTLSGGEVLLRRDFFAIAGAARARGFGLRIFTNGTLVDEPTADRLAALEPIVVEMSLLGATPQTHDAITLKRGSFARTVRAARLLGARAVRVKLKTTLMRPNVAEAAEMATLAEGLGAQHQVSFVVMPKRDGDPSPLALQVGDRALRRHLARRERELDEAPVPRAVGDDGLCSAGRAACSISPAGDVYPCVLLPLKAGSVRERPFGAIWREAPQLHLMRELIARHKIGCNNCDDEGHFFCPALNMLQSGDPAQIAPQAVRGRALWRDLGL